MTKKIIGEIKVGVAMSRNVVTIRPDATLKEAHELFQKYDYNAFPVVKDGSIIGIITKFDILRAFSVGTRFRVSSFWDTLSENVSDVMRTAIVSVTPDDELQTVVDYMVEFELRSLPVVEGDKVVGMISRDDLMQHLYLED
ncbi:MAG: CBS domain-containing protein [Euryarchaeota archaeon]|nr:CBS domain-containing protein [Euryarchaeota archaeon]